MACGAEAVGGTLGSPTLLSALPFSVGAPWKCQYSCPPLPAVRSKPNHEVPFVWGISNEDTLDFVLPCLRSRLCRRDKQTGPCPVSLLSSQCRGTDGSVTNAAQMTCCFPSPENSGLQGADVL